MLHAGLKATPRGMAQISAALKQLFYCLAYAFCIKHFFTVADSYVVCIAVLKQMINVINC